MDDVDAGNAAVLVIFAGCIVAVIVAYLIARRSKRNAFRRLGSLTVAAVTGFAGLLISFWILGAIMPLPPPDGSPLWKPLVFAVAFAPLPIGAFYMSARFIRRAGRQGREESKAPD
jgi:MFS family permease